MLHILVGLGLGLFMIVGYLVVCRDYASSEEHQGAAVISILVGLFAGFLSYCSVDVNSASFLVDHPLVFEKADSVVYDLVEVNNNYYNITGSENSVSINILNDDNTWYTDTFESDVVTFQKGDEAQIQIENETSVWSENNKNWYLKEQEPVIRAAKVVITVPEEK